VIEFDCFKFLSKFKVSKSVIIFSLASLVVMFLTILGFFATYKSTNISWANVMKLFTALID
jgi:hypothetical protein